MMSLLFDALRTAGKTARGLLRQRVIRTMWAAKFVLSLLPRALARSARVRLPSSDLSKFFLALETYAQLLHF